MKVPASDVSKVEYFVESIYASEMFNDKEMQAWEVSGNQSLASAKNHLITLYESKKKFIAEHKACTGGSDMLTALPATTTVAHTTVLISLLFFLWPHVSLNTANDA
jgi:hypothetical protein